LGICVFWLCGWWLWHRDGTEKCVNSSANAFGIDFFFWGNAAVRRSITLCARARGAVFIFDTQYGADDEDYTYYYKHDSPGKGGQNANALNLALSAALGFCVLPSAIFGGFFFAAVIVIICGHSSFLPKIVD
jgi:hypothetical protein